MTDNEVAGVVQCKPHGVTPEVGGCDNSGAVGGAEGHNVTEGVVEQGTLTPEERIDAYIRNAKWVEARTWRKTFPHEYTLREWAPEREDDFIFFVKYIRENGQVEPFFSKRYTYLHWRDGYKYWTLGFPLDITRVINRAMPGRDRGA